MRAGLFRFIMQWAYYISTDYYPKSHQKGIFKSFFDENGLIYNCINGKRLMKDVTERSGATKQFQKNTGNKGSPCTFWYS